ncbi:hypothetical protein Asulf_01969 [Archaeoglobus sulfaticallidus PM70-1]|uniref:Uncharacterized protein n=1 Tax=Archaeoglobus sulfaticallidus PM70-1 TaxID=387631 RepID=N0BNN3_9EURY|nr:hypothetical protein [Archaeoglobus sulfaticallidus]AGK61935.1 hypothetical protein Asulf_01969 [Archaeoglobus sulfaticallidus PM70-1]
MSDCLDRKEMLKKIMDSFEHIKKALREKSVCEGRKVIIFDPPYTLHLMKDEYIALYYENEELACLTYERFSFCDDVACQIMDSWLKTLTSFGFKRFLLRRR